MLIGNWEQTIRPPFGGLALFGEWQKSKNIVESLY